MTEITNEGLIELRDSNNLTPGEVYLITNYYVSSTKIYLTADSDKTFLDEATSDDPNIKIHYDLDQAKIDYMKDTVNRIEGYFDWTNNVQGDCSDIYFENAELLIVNESSNVILEDDVASSSIVKSSNNITIGKQAVVDISGCSNITVGGYSTLTIDTSEDITVGERNNLSINQKNSVFLSDDNEDITVASFNKVGSRNKGVSIEGNSNIVKSDNRDLNINGDLNHVESSRYVELGGSFNDVEKTDLTGLQNAVGNKVLASSSVDIVNTNNNTVSVRDIIIQNKEPFIEYVSAHNSPIKVVRNLIEPVNMQADCQARTLIMDEEKFYQETGSSGSKGSTKYVLVDGIWTAVQI